MICPPDVLCRWLPEEDRWETMEELALALERESLMTIKQAERQDKSKIRIGLRRIGDIRKWRLSAEQERRIERMMGIVSKKKEFVA